ncbi:MAG: allophanate hydrolase [Actinomycetota bacterium]|nr:allophanate hydrolase [Actinomycetota bacterium]
MTDAPRSVPEGDDARAAVVAFFDRLEALDDPAIFLAIAERAALVDLAGDIDLRPADEVPLRGLVFGVKDNIDVLGMETTAGCPAYGYQPARSAFVVERLLAAGALPVAKTNMDQFATGLVGTRSPNGVPRNPHNPLHVPGGSSSGSAVAVARGLVDFALGTDTAGSGRVPAAFCGIVGLKPTLGLVSTSGSVPAVRSADCISIFAREVGLAARVTEVAAVFDPGDAMARPRRSSSGRSLPELRVGIADPATLRVAGADEATIAAYADAVERFRACVDQLVTVDLMPLFEAGDLLYGGPFVAERTAAVGEFIDQHLDQVDPIVGQIIRGGAAHTAVDAHRARYRLAELRRSAEAQFEHFDVLLLPTVPHGALISEVAAEPLAGNARLGRFTTFANLVDLCALSLPSGPVGSNGVPFGVTLYGPAFDDATLLVAAAAIMGETPGAGLSENADRWVTLVVAGAHLKGQPLEHQLVDLGARFGRTTRTADTYRLYALADTQPPKPGLVHDLSGTSIEVDTWRLTIDALGQFLGTVPAPLALGTVVLEDGTAATGFVCEPRALAGAIDISHLGGWRAYRRQVSAASG